MTIKDLMKKMKEEYTPSEFKEEWKCVVNAAKNKAEHTVRNVKYKIKNDVHGEEVYKDLQSALYEIKRRVGLFVNDWEKNFTLTVSPKREFVPSAKSLPIEDVVEITQLPRCVWNYLPQDIQDKYFEVVEEKTARLMIKRAPSKTIPKTSTKGGQDLLQKVLQ